MKTKLVNAGIKSMGELATRLESGEVFWYRVTKSTVKLIHPQTLFVSTIHLSGYVGTNSRKWK